MNTNSKSRSTFFILRVSIGFVLCAVGAFLALAGLSKTVTGTIATSVAINPPDGGDAGGCVPPPTGLVSWWAADQDSTDLQGNNAGILLKGASYAPGFVSRAAFSFDGVDDVVQVGSDPSLKMTSAMTME